MENMEDKNVSYTELISTMMFGFGDNQSPNADTVKLVENAVLKQLRDVLHEASKIADRREVQQVNAEDILFLMRQDRHKVQRFIKHAEYKYSITSLACNDNDNENLSFSDKTKRKKFEVFKSIVENIDETGELLDTNEFDEVKHDRLVRAERISYALDEEKYKEYTKARQVSFSHKKFSNQKLFRNWVDPLNEINLSQPAIEILELLAYSIVGHITDMALIIRQNSKRVSGDPLQMLKGSFYNSSMFNAPHISDKHNAAVAALGQTAITVREIREALRRYYMPQVGYMNFSHKSMLGKRKLMM